MKMTYHFGWILILALGNHLSGAQRVAISGTGIITYSTLTGTAVNDSIAISVSYNPAVSPTHTAFPTQSGGAVARFGIGTDLGVSIQFNGYNWQAQMPSGATGVSGFEPIQIQNDDPMLQIFGAAGDGDAITFVALPTLTGNSLTLDPLAPNPDNLFVLTFNDSSGPYDLFSNHSLPDIGNVPNFAAVTMSDGVFRIGGSDPFEIRYRLNPTSMSLAAVPEPSIGVLSLAGVALYCVGFRRRFAR